MATKKVKLSFAQLRCLRNSSVFGAAEWSFSLTVDGQKVGDPKKRFTVKPGKLVSLGWSHEVDVTARRAATPSRSCSVPRSTG